MTNDRWRGQIVSEQAKPQPSSKYNPWLVAIIVVVGFGCLVAYLHSLPVQEHRRRLKRGELARKHQKYLDSQAKFTAKHYAFHKHEFEPDFSAVTTLEPTCSDRCSSETCKHVQRSTLHSQCCNTNVTEETWIFPLLITATPRSGTVATLNLFRTLKLELGDDWDKPGQHGRISWIHGFNEYDHVQHPGNQKAMAYYGQPHKALVGDRFRVIIHLVRDPLSSVTSIACTEPLADIQWSEFVRTHIPLARWDRGNRNDFLIAMQMWLEWHQFLDSLCLFRIRLEDLFNLDKAGGIIRDIFTLIGKAAPSNTIVRDALHELKTDKSGHKQNQRDHRPKVTWQELYLIDPELTRRLHERSCKYGYFCDVDISNLEQEAKAARIKPPVCDFEEDTDRGWSPGLVSALPKELQPV